MRAIHNNGMPLTTTLFVVPDVKDTNLWEQFTTYCYSVMPYYLLFLMSKIRTYESNSQQDPPPRFAGFCCSWCQRYELMRAIHNSRVLAWFYALLFLMSKIRTYESNSQHGRTCMDHCSVVPDVKDTNLWEQFTTTPLKRKRSGWLFLMSKIRTYESNSQPFSIFRLFYWVVPDVKDTNLWEQFTTLAIIWYQLHWLFLMSKIRTYESNSQQCTIPREFQGVVPDVKDTNLWEQFTTKEWEFISQDWLFLMSKIRTYESNSQPLEWKQTMTEGCSWCQRYELMRAIHNYSFHHFTIYRLFLMSKIRTYESNSQPLWSLSRFDLCCSWCQRYELMRAIHNPKADRAPRIVVVPDVKDTNLWEQFTTIDQHVRTH